VASARIQLYVVTRAHAIDTPALSSVDGRLGVTWRLLSTNNRDLGRAARIFPDIESCLAALRHLRSQLPSAMPVTARSDRTSWVWRIVVAGEDVAVSSRSYHRRVHCEYACTVFLSLVPDATVTDAPRVVSSSSMVVATLP
jgi:hypothetical protein